MALEFFSDRDGDLAWKESIDLLERLVINPLYTDQAQAACLAMQETIEEELPALARYLTMESERGVLTISAKRKEDVQKAVDYCDSAVGELRKWADGVDMHQALREVWGPAEL